MIAHVFSNITSCCVENRQGNRVEVFARRLVRRLLQGPRRDSGTRAVVREVMGRCWILVAPVRLADS